MIDIHHTLLDIYERYHLTGRQIARASEKPNGINLKRLIIENANQRHRNLDKSKNNDCS